MHLNIYILSLGLLIASCGQTSPKADNNSPETINNTAQDNNKATQSTAKQAQLDSIDKANHESVMASGAQVTKAYVDLKDANRLIHLTANMRQDHRIFGYEKPDTKSERLLLLSVFTSDVENNPFGCKLGAFYDTNGMEEGAALKYISTTGDFVQAAYVDKSKQSTTVYFEKKWIVVE
jgi:hypothetical protein